MTRQRKHIATALILTSTVAMLLGSVIFTSMHAKIADSLTLPSSPSMRKTQNSVLPTDFPQIPSPSSFSKFDSTTLPPILEPTPSPISPTNFPTLIPWVEQQLTNLSLTEKIGQMIMMGINGQEYSSETCQLISEVSQGSIVYRKSNVVSPDQLRQFSARIHNCNTKIEGTIPILIAMDHEGQYVFRFDKSATVFPSAMGIGATSNPALAYQVSLASGQELVLQ